MAMMIEKKFAETDLNKYVKSPREQFVIAVLQHRDFNTNYALDLIKPKWENLFARPTATFYFGEILRYATTGISILSMDYKCLIDKNKHIEAIKPSEGHARRKLNRKNKKDAPVKKVVSQIVQAKNEVIEKFLYGIKFNGCCTMTFENKQEQEMFLKGLEMASMIKDYKKVHVKSDAITEVE